MAFMLEDRPVRPITVEQAMHMLEHGLLPDADRIELLQGAFVEKPVKHPPHELVKERLNHWLSARSAPRQYRVRVESPFVVPDRISLPEPDLSVLAVGEELQHASSALLLIEIADISLNIDDGVKTLLYAAAEVPEYWVVNVNAHRVQVFTDPRDGYFAHRIAISSPEVLLPKRFAIEPLDLSELFAGLD